MYKTGGDKGVNNLTNLRKLHILKTRTHIL